MSAKRKPLSFDDAVFPAVDKPSATVRAWQAEKIAAGVKAADEGRFATTEQVQAVIRKYLLDG